MSEGRGGRPDVWIEKTGEIWISKPDNGNGDGLALTLEDPLELFGFGLGDYQLGPHVGDPSLSICVPPLGCEDCPSQPMH